MTLHRRCNASGAAERIHRYKEGRGGVPERSNGPVLKTGEGSRPPWVQIPPPPPSSACADLEKREGTRSTFRDQEATKMAATAYPQSGTKDKNYDLITVTQLCLEHTWRLDQYAQDAEREGDPELSRLFRGMQDHSRRGAEQCKQLLGERLND